MRKIYLLSTLVLTILLGSKSYAQDYSNKGKEFWISYPEHINGTNSIMGLYLTSDVNTTGSINDNGTLIPFTVTANTITVIFLGSAPGCVGPNSYIHLGNLQDGIKTGAAVHVTSALPIVVFAHIINSARSGATLALPTNVWGKEYIVPSYANSGGNGANQGYGELNVMAALPNTQIEITPSITSRNGARVAGIPYTITLTNPGDVYQLQFPQSTDLSGTKIKSVAVGAGGCLPIAVFSASTWSAINCGSGNGGDNFYQQLFPYGAWGKQFFTSPLKKVPTNVNDHNTDIIRVYVKDPTTIVRKIENGVITILGGLTAQGFYEYSTEYPTYLEADKPVQVIEFIKTQNCNTPGSPVTQSDPEMIVLSSIEQTINDITVYSAINTAVPAGNSNINIHYINVIMKSANTGTFRINGIPPASSWWPIPGTNYSYLKQNIPAGTPVSRLRADSAFSAYAYGFGSVESYGYNAGTYVRDLSQGIELETEYGIENNSICTGSPFKFKIYFPDSTLATPPVEVRFDSLKWDLTNRAIVTPNNFPVVQAPPVIDSTTIVNGRRVNWYSLPGFYTFTSPGLDTLIITAYKSTNEGCGTDVVYEFPIQISNPPPGDFTWTTTGCIGQPVQFTETTPQTPKITYRWWWDFGDPASGPLNNSNVRNPVHTFMGGAGTYTIRYLGITTAGCLSDTITKQITLTDPPSATYSVNPPLCVNIPIQFNDQTIPPPGATIAVWAWNFGDPGSGPLNISSNQNPTHIYTNPGTYAVTLQVETNSGCPSAVYSSQVIIAPDGTITLSSAPGTNNQTVCINTPITTITYVVGGSSNGGSVSGLPAGVTGSFAGGIITISGTPTVSGTFNYTVTTTGPCINPTATGTITITPDGTIALTSAAGTDNQTVCINTPIVNITYAIGASGTGGSVSGLPAGVTGSFAGGIITITGTPTVSGTFNYTVTTTGPCVNPAATGTITVTPDGTITLTSAPGTNNQTVCINTPIINITYAVGASGTGGSVSGLPAGVTGSFAAGVITITGSPTVFGTFNYTVTTTGPCIKPTATGTITINPDATITLTSPPATTNQELCINATIATITYSIAGGGTGGTVTGLPTGVNGVFAGGIFTISGTPTVSGVFNYTVSTTGICVQISATGIITVNALPTANFNSTVPSCETRTINFFDISVPNSGNIISWAWNFGDPPSGPGNTSNLQNPSHTYANAGVYNVSLVVTTDKGCVSITPPRQVIINDRPLAGFIIPEVCLSDTYAQFTDTSQLANAAIDRWDWNFGDPGSGPLNISNLQNPTHSYTATGNYSVRLIVWSSAIGCRDTITQTLTVNGSFPNADFTVNNPTTLCANDSVSIAEASTVFPGSITKVEIYWDNVGQPGVFDTDNFPVTGKIYKHLYPNFQAPLTRTFTIRYRAYSGGVCVNDRLRNITVNAAPLVQFNNVPNICYDAAPYQIPPAIASETGGVPGNGVFSGPGVSPTGLFSPAVAGPGTHRILYTFTSTAGGCIDTASNTIRVWDTASAQIGVQALACERSSVSFNSTNSTIPPGNGSITGWAWNFGDPPSGASNTSSLSNPSHLFTGWGNYNVSLNVLTSNGCRSTVRTIPVDVKPVPRPNFSFPISSCLPSATVAFNSSASSIPDGTPFQSYLWNFGDPASGALNTSTGANPSHIYNNVGPFTVNLQITSSVGCVRDTNIILNTIHPQPLAAITSNKNDVCVGQSFTFTDNSDPADGTTISRNWTMGDGGVRTNSPVNYTYAAAGTYNVTLYIINSHGCRSTTATRTVTVNPYPIVNAGPDLFILEDGSDTLETIITAINPTYLWTPNLYFLGSNTVKNPVVKGVDDITYTLTVTGQGGCASSDEVFIKVLKGPEIPNIFSPNGDGIHDTWLIKYLDTYPGCTVDIFNRYGQLIYHIVGYGIPWDGKINGNPVPMGTYYYIVNPKNGRKIMSGYVDVIR